MTQYKLVKAVSLRHLEDQINDWLTRGWELHGTILHFPEEYQPYQHAMVKKD
jgi:hypothetical protein